MANLTDKQLRFIEEYLIDLNATQAAIRAGYKFKSRGLKYYVYLLINPLNNHIIYIGKGKGFRYKCHRSSYMHGKVDNAAKFHAISEIETSNNRLIEVILEDDLSESNAYRLEYWLISKFKHCPSITNIANGVVPEIDKQVAHSLDMVKRLKSYRHWVETTDLATLSTVQRLFGNTKVFYDQFKSNLIRLTVPYEPYH